MSLMFSLLFPFFLGYLPSSKGLYTLNLMSYTTSPSFGTLSSLRNPTIFSRLVSPGRILTFPTSGFSIHSIILGISYSENSSVVYLSIHARILLLESIFLIFSSYFAFAPAADRSSAMALFNNSANYCSPFCCITLYRKRFLKSAHIFCCV